MRALLFLEWRYARNQIVAIVHSRARLALWIPFALSLAVLWYARVARSHDHAGSTGIAQLHATAIGSLYFGFLGATIAAAAAGRVAAYRSRAEAVLFGNAGIRPLTVALWLQARKLGAGSGRSFGTVVYMFLFLVPGQLGPVATACALLAILLALALALSLELPVFLLARRRLKLPLALGGSTLASAGFAYAALDMFGGKPLRADLRMLRVDPGQLALATLEGRPVTLLVLASLLAVLFIVVRSFGDDALPELYLASQRAQARIDERRSRTPKIRFSSASGGAARVPAGALALVWKDWIGFKRGRVVLRIWLAGCVFWALCGAGVAFASAHYRDAALLVTLLSMTAIVLLVVASTGASLGLASELAQPLFWLSRAPLRSRIAAWTCGRAWRGAVALALAPVAAGIVSGDIVLATAAAPVVLAAYWSLQALGVGLYALFPNPLDTRGPMALVRMFLTAAYAVPALLVAVAAALLHGDPMLVTLAAAATLGAQGWAVVELASLRFSEHGAALATLGRAT